MSKHVGGRQATDVYFLSTVQSVLSNAVQSVWGTCCGVCVVFVCCVCMLCCVCVLKLHDIECAATAFGCWCMEMAS